jgi:hypothetical protein
MNSISACGVFLSWVPSRPWGRVLLAKRRHPLRLIVVFCFQQTREQAFFFGGACSTRNLCDAALLPCRLRVQTAHAGRANCALRSGLPPRHSDPCSRAVDVPDAAARYRRVPRRSASVPVSGLRHSAAAPRELLVLEGNVLRLRGYCGSARVPCASAQERVSRWAGVEISSTPSSLRFVSIIC